MINVFKSFGKLCNKMKNCETSSKYKELISDNIDSGLFEEACIEEKTVLQIFEGPRFLEEYFNHYNLKENMAMVNQL